MRTTTYILLFFCGIAHGQYTSPFNQLKWENTDSIADYSFIVSGHFYGGSGNATHFPANTLLANLDWINNSGADALVCLGDLFLDIQNDIDAYQTSFFNKLEIPLVNSVGNHDLSGDIYQNNYGKTTFSFKIGNDIHIVLDTERDNGDIQDDQLSLLIEANKQASKGGVNNVFIYTHRTIWADAYSEMDGLFEDNTQSLTGTNYKADVLPLLSEIAKNANVHLFSGSLGHAPASFFYFKDKPNNVSIIATAIRALPRDAMLLVNVKNGEPNFELHSLTGETLQPLSHYDVPFWQKNVGKKPFNWRLVPYYFQLMFTHRYFWYGTLYTAAFGLMALYVLRRRKQKKQQA